MELPFADISWFWTGLLVLILGYIYFRYTNAIYSYWEKRGIKHEPAISAIAMLYRILRKNGYDLEMERYKKYRDIYGIYEGKDPILYVTNPDLIKNILVKDFPSLPNRRRFENNDAVFDKMVFSINGDTWKRIRSIISPTFSTGKIKRMSSIIVDCAQTLVKLFADNAGKPMETKSFYNAFAMDVIASAAFATKLHSHQDPNNIFLQNARKVFPRNLTWRFLFFALFPSLQKIFSLFDASATKFFMEETLKIIEDRKKSGKIRNDFLQLLMETEKETLEMENKKTNSKVDKEDEKNIDDINADELGHDENNSQIFKLPKNIKSLSRDELIAQCVMFFIVGFPTTAATLAYLTYSLALNPDIQDKLKEEVDAVILNHGKQLTYAAIQDMPYLDKVLTETLRKFPAVLRIERVAAEDYKLGDTGVVIEKGQLVAIPAYAIHKDPKFYPEPEKFDPERFSAEGKASRHPYTYLAFGAGPRNCVAMRFALMEVKFCIAYLVSQLTIKQCAETKVPLEIFSGLGLLEPLDVTLIFEVRKDRVFDGLQEKQENRD